MKTFITMIAVFAIALSFILLQPMQTSSGQPISTDPTQLVAQNPDEFTIGPNGNVVAKNSYIVTLKNETFASIDNNPKFADPDKFKASNIPEKNAEVVPELQHEYMVETGEIIYDKVNEYNGTETSSLAPLPAQGGSVDQVYSHAVRGFSIVDTEDISIFVNDPDIAAVEPVNVVSPGLQYTSLGNDRIDQDKTVTAAYRPDNVENFPDIDVAVVDTRVQQDHPDLNVFQYRNFLSSDISTAGGYHGTHVAGIIAARDNLGGTVGVVPGARIWSLAICPPSASGCLASFALAAFDFLTANAATIEVANMSVGCAGGTFGAARDCVASSAEYTALTNAKNAGVTIISIAMNDRRDATNIFYCDSPATICVSALADFDGKCGGLMPSVTSQWSLNGQALVQADDTIAVFSNYGSPVDMMAPGWRIISTFPPGQGVLEEQGAFIGLSAHGGYGILSGTSMAGPYVAGAAALVKLNNPSFTPAQVLTDLQAKAVAQNQACDGSSKGGLVVGANTLSSEKLLYIQPY